MSGAASVLTFTAITHFTLSWANITGSGGGYHKNADQTIPFISIPCTLQFNISPSPTFDSRYYLNGSVNGQLIANGATLIVHAGDTLHFGVDSNTALSGAVTIINVTDGGSTVSTFTYAIT